MIKNDKGNISVFSSSSPIYKLEIILPRKSQLKREMRFIQDHIIVSFILIPCYDRIPDIQDLIKIDAWNHNHRVLGYGRDLWNQLFQHPNVSGGQK